MEKEFELFVARFAKFLNTYRQVSGAGFTTIAQRAELAHDTVRKIAAGETRNPTCKTLFKIYHACGFESVFYEPHIRPRSMKRAA